jgi:hypothetical protein
MVLGMKYLPAVIALAVAAPATLSGQQAGKEKPSVAVLKVTGDMAPHDTLSLAHSIKRGMQVDSLVELLERPPADGQLVQRDGKMIRPVCYIVTAVTQQIGDMHRVSVRVFNSATSNIAGGESTRAASAALSDSLVALGRRLARTLADTRP